MGSAPAGRGKRGDAGGGPQTFRSTTAALVWWVWLLFFAANMIDIAVQGRDHLSAVAAAILVLVTGIAYVGAQRPRVIAGDAGLTIRNPLRDYQIGWAGVTKVDLADLLRVHCAWDSQQDGKRHTKIISAWAVHYSRRQKLIAESRARRAAQPRGLRSGSRGSFGSPPPAAPRADELEAEKIARLLTERATAARAESVWAAGTVPISGSKAVKPAKPPKSTRPASTPETAAPDPAITPAATASNSAFSSATTPSATASNSATAFSSATTASATASNSATTASATATASDARTGAGYAADLAAAPGLAGTGWLEPLRSTWNTTALAALIIPAVILIIVCLL